MSASIRPFTTPDGPFKDYAQRYFDLGMGFNPIPTKERTAPKAKRKAPFSTWEEYQVSGTSQEILAAHLKQYGDRDIGTLLTLDCPFVIVDIDGGGYSKFIEMGLTLPTNTPVVLSGGTDAEGNQNRYHIYFDKGRFAHILDVNCPATNPIWPGINIELRSVACFTVLPPTLHLSGHRYQWLENQAPWEVEMQEAPAWLWRAVAIWRGQDPDSVKPSFEHLSDKKISKIQEGKRNDYITSWCGWFRTQKSETFDPADPEFEPYYAAALIENARLPVPMDGGEVRNTANSIFKHALKDAPKYAEAAKKASWQARLRRTDKGKIVDSPVNHSIILEHDPALSGKIRMNKMANTIQLGAELPWKTTGPLLQDADVNELTIYLDATYALKSAPSMLCALSAVSTRHGYHPITDIIDTVTWDGTPRIDTVLIDLCQTTDIPEHRLMTRKWFIGGVSRIYKPGQKFDYCLVLVGDTGIGKSQFFHRVALSEDWFLDLNHTIDGGKNVPELLQGKWVAEFAEMSSMRTSEHEAIKAFITQQNDPYRAAYGRVVEQHPRQCVLGASSNRYDFLRDHTSSRRFWPMRVHDMSGMWDKMDRAHVLQLWAEAKTYLLAGENPNLTREEEDLVEKCKEEFTEEDSQTVLIQQWLDKPVPTGWSKLTPAERLKVTTSVFENPENTEVWDVFTQDDLVVWYLGKGVVDSSLQRQAADKVFIKKLVEACMKLPGWKYGSPHVPSLRTNHRGWKRL